MFSRTRFFFFSKISVGRHNSNPSVIWPRTLAEIWNDTDFVGKSDLSGCEVQFFFG